MDCSLNMDIISHNNLQWYDSTENTVKNVGHNEGGEAKLHAFISVRTLYLITVHSV